MLKTPEAMILPASSTPPKMPAQRFPSATRLLISSWIRWITS